MLRFAHLEFQVFIGQVLGLSVNSLELTETHCLLNGVLDVSLGFIVLSLVHALCSMWAGSELALLNCLSEIFFMITRYYSLPSVYNTIVRSRDTRMTAVVSRDQNQS